MKTIRNQIKYLMILNASIEGSKTLLLFIFFIWIQREQQIDNKQKIS